MNDCIHGATEEDAGKISDLIAQLAAVRREASALDVVTCTEQTKPLDPRHAALLQAAATIYAGRWISNYDLPRDRFEDTMNASNAVSVAEKILSRVEREP